jgi:protease-4
MKSFFKVFFAVLLALIVFMIMIFFIVTKMISGAVNTREAVPVDNNSVLVIDLDNLLREQNYVNPLNALFDRDNVYIPGLHDITTAIRQAAKDNRIKGIYLKSDDDPNGFATNEELRRALLDFRRSGKFIYAYGSVISQKAYYVASVADKIFLNPAGMLDFSGFSVQMVFLKGTLDKLDIQPQIFYEGKFKSATEPLRTTQMTEANKVQTREYLENMYQHFITGISEARNIDTASLYRYADGGQIRTAYDALRYGLVDGLKYNDEIRDIIRRKSGVADKDKIHFIEVSKYVRANPAGDRGNVNDKIALVYAQGDILSGDNPGNNEPVIVSENYIRLIRELREDSTVKAIVFRINSPGGSALAADEIWRELLLAKQVKPVVVSMGDYAASGGYYISCVADSIFAEANTLTGSIGVFGIIPNLQSFFKNKLGVTFDGVKTAQYADMGNIARPLTPTERQFIQADIDSVYATFKYKVTEGRHLPMATVDSIAQGRVWSGTDALKLGLVDKLGGLNAAITCAANMAHIKSYIIREYPKQKIPFQKVIHQLTNEGLTHTLQEQLGENYSIYLQLKRIKDAKGEILARLPYDVNVK